MLEVYLLQSCIRCLSGYKHCMCKFKSLMLKNTTFREEVGAKHSKSGEGEMQTNWVKSNKLHKYIDAPLKEALSRKTRQLQSHNIHKKNILDGLFFDIMMSCLFSYQMNF